MVDYIPLMREAIEIAKLALVTDDVPVGALVINPAGAIVGRGKNLREINKDPTAHAEIIVIRNAAKILKNYRLIDASLYVTVEPCAMCFGALLQARINKLIFGAKDPKFGAIGGVADLTNYKWTHKFEIEGGILEQDSKVLLQEFFKNKR